MVITNSYYTFLLDFCSVQQPDQKCLSFIYIPQVIGASSYYCILSRGRICTFSHMGALMTGFTAFIYEFAIATTYHILIRSHRFKSLSQIDPLWGGNRQPLTLLFTMPQDIPGYKQETEFQDFFTCQYVFFMCLYLLELTQCFKYVKNILNQVIHVGNVEQLHLSNHEL